MHSYVRAPGLRLHNGVDRRTAFAPPDWTRVVELATEIGVKTATYFSLATARAILRTPIPDHVLVALAPAAWKRAVVARWIRAVDLFEPNERQFRRPALLAFQSLLYDDVTSVRRVTLRRARSVPGDEGGPRGRRPPHAISAVTDLTQAPAWSGTKSPATEAVRGPEILIGSVVDGGPMQRLVQHLERRGRVARVVSSVEAQGWRGLFSEGRLGRLRGRLRAFTTFPLEFVAQVRRTEAAVAVPTTNPFTLPILTVALRRLHGKPVVPLVYDLYPDGLEAVNLVRRGSITSRLAAAINRWWIRESDGVVFIGHRMARSAIERYGAPRRWTIIETGASTEELKSPPDGEAQHDDLDAWLEGKVVLSYVGNLGRLHDWDTLKRAVPEVLADAREAGVRVGVLVAAFGPGAEALRSAWADQAPDEVRFEPPLDDARWARVLRASAISLVTLHASASDVCVPSKAFSALAAGSALVAVAPAQSDLAELVRENACGAAVAPGDVENLRTTLRELVTDPVRLREARNGAAVAARRYDLAALAVRWEEFLAQVTDERAPC